VGKKKQKVKSALKLGGKGLVNFGIGGALLSGARRIPDFAGPYQGAVDKILVGGGTKLVGLKGQSDLLTAGVKELLADVLDLEVIPRLSQGLGGLLGGARAANGGNGRRVLTSNAYTA